VVVDRGSCIFFCSYPTGTNSLIRAIAKDAKTNLEAADSLVSMYAAESLDEDHRRTVAPIMSKLGKDWSDELDKLMKDGALSQALPASTLIAARNHEDFFVKAFHSSHPGSKVEIFSIDQVAPHVAFEDSADHVRIVAMYALAINNLVTGSR
jgi:hypothetical protein